MEAIELTLGTYIYRYYFDITTQTEGVNLYTKSGKYIGSIVTELPDNEDLESYEAFKKEIEYWITENA